MNAIVGFHACRIWFELTHPCGNGNASLRVNKLFANKMRAIGNQVRWSPVTGVGRTLYSS